MRFFLFVFLVVSSGYAFEFKHSDNGYIVVLQTGEEVFPALIELAKQEGIRSAWIHGIGAVGEVELGYYDVKDGQYKRKKFQEELEITSLSGNLSSLQGEPFVHLHGVFGTSRFQALTGHVFSAKISITGEFLVLPFAFDIPRKPSPQFRSLNLMSLKNSG